MPRRYIEGRGASPGMLDVKIERTNSRAMVRAELPLCGAIRRGEKRLAVSPPRFFQNFDFFFPEVFQLDYDGVTLPKKGNELIDSSVIAYCHKMIF
jgi:hypothetical protein